MQVQSEDKPYDDINITPMLDLAYVLLVIFIIMTTAAVQGMKVDLPHASAQQSLATPTTKSITITSDGRFSGYRSGEHDRPAEHAWWPTNSRPPNFPVVVSGDGQASYQTIMNVLDLLGRLDTSPRWGLPPNPTRPMTARHFLAQKITPPSSSSAAR